MPASSPAKAAFAGFNLADDLKEFEVEDARELRPKPDPTSLATVSERAGFPSREPKPPKPAAPVRELKFDERLTLRVTEADRKRFDDIVYRLRAANGEAFAKVLDAFEAQEAAAGRAGG